MRLTKFNELMNDEFGAGYAAVLMNDLVLTDLEDQTGNQAIASGIDPKEVWAAICKSAPVPKERWHGVNKKPKA